MKKKPAMEDKWRSSIVSSVNGVGGGVGGEEEPILQLLQLFRALKSLDYSSSILGFDILSGRVGRDIWRENRSPLAGFWPMILEGEGGMK